MADIYTRMRATSQRLLAPTNKGGLGQGKIELVRYTPAPPPPNLWDAPLEPVRQVTPLDGVARGVGKEMVGAPVENGGQIVATDLLLTVAPWSGSYKPTDTIEVDGSPVTILSCKNIPAAGTACAIQFVARR